MFAAHLAAGLAIKAAEPRAPAWAVLAAAFLPDLFWIGFAGAGLEPASDAGFFDGWSHSVVSIIVQAAAFGLCFARFGWPVAMAVASAVLSHIPLDAIIHPKPLELWPHSSLVLGVPDWAWGQATLIFKKSRYWCVQLAITLPLLGFYWRYSRQRLPTNSIFASCLIVLGLHLLF